jgi:LmbE family N-acetylglucosaminyl deacetylase
MVTPKKVLVLSAHAGDEMLGCGGTLALHAKRGDQVRVVVLGDGVSSRVRSLQKAQVLLDFDTLENQSRVALGTLGVEKVDYFRLPDNRFDTIPLLDIVKRVEDVKNSFVPDVVYTNSPFDLSVDERRTFQAMITAFRPQPNDNAAELYSFELLSSTEWNMPESPFGFRPNVFVDIESVLETKIKAFSRLESEVREWPHTRSLKSIEARARDRGASAGMTAAEAFLLLRSVRTSL